MAGGLFGAVLTWLAILGPPVIGAGVGRYAPALLMSTILVALASFWPESADAIGDDWRPVAFPFWLAGALLLTTGGVAARRWHRR